MDNSMVIELGRQAIWISILVCAPLLTVALLVGVVIGIVQAATSINEMTLSFIPKLVLMALVSLVFGSWQLSLLVDYMRGIFERIPTLFH
ncbi:MAG: Flagellar biosynthetic protein FliQ [Pseudomonadota bacterium]|jgi:flagellar biosynthetic protein FliQ